MDKLNNADIGSLLAPEAAGGPPHGADVLELDRELLGMLHSLLQNHPLLPVSTAYVTCCVAGSTHVLHAPCMMTVPYHRRMIGVWISFVDTQASLLCAFANESQCQATCCQIGFTPSACWCNSEQQGNIRFAAATEG